MDANALDRELYRHRPFLLRLASALVGRDEAEDLVQDVWTRVLEGQRPSPVQARSWLARVARNLAVTRFRARDRRARREREHPRNESPEDAVTDASATFELSQTVAAAVRALEEPYRSAVLLRFFEGLMHEEIAARLGVPLATVRTRQQRALAQLRTRLDREFGRREAWSVALGSWLTRDSIVVGTTPVVTLSWLALGTAAAGALTLAVWRAWPGPALGPNPVEPVAALEAAAPVPSSVPSPSTAVRRPIEPPAALTQGSQTPWRRLVGSIVGLTPGELARTSIRVQGIHREIVFPERLVASATPGADGTFVVDLTPLYAEQDRHVPQEFLLLVDHPRHMPAEQRLLPELATNDGDGNSTLQAGELRLVPAAVVHGTIRNESGEPVADASLEAYRLDQGLPLVEPRGVTTSDPQGRFVLRLAEGAPHALVALQEGWRPTTRIESVTPGQEVELGPFLLERGFALSGVANVLGAAHGGVEVILHPSRPLHRVARHGRWGSIGFAEGRFEWSNLRADSDPSGAFAFGGLAPREYRLSTHGLRDTRTTMGRRARETLVRAPADGVALEFDGVRVTIDPTGPFAPETSGEVEIESPDNRVEVSFRLGDGPVRFVGPAETHLVLRIRLAGSDTQTIELDTPGPGEEVRRSVALVSGPAKARLHLEARSLAGRPLPGIALLFQPPTDEPGKFVWRPRPGNGCIELVDGHATIEVEPGSYLVEAHVYDEKARDGRLFHVPLEFRLTLRPGEEFTQPLDFSPGGYVRVDTQRPDGIRERVRFRILDARGTELWVQMEAHDGARGSIQGVHFLEPWGPNELLHALPPGDYTLRVWDDDVPEQRLPFAIVAGETTELAVMLETR